MLWFTTVTLETFKSTKFLGSKAVFCAAFAFYRTHRTATSSEYHPPKIHARAVFTHLILHITVRSVRRRHGNGGRNQTSIRGSASHWLRRSSGSVLARNRINSSSANSGQHSEEETGKIVLKVRAQTGLSRKKEARFVFFSHASRAGCWSVLGTASRLSRKTKVRG